MTSSTPSWIQHFGGLATLAPAIRQTLAAASGLVTLPAGTRIYGPGRAPESFLLLISGTVRVQQVSAGGREIVLYRVSGGESCPLTTACLMGYEEYPAEAIAESDIEAVAIPRSTFDDLIARSPEFRRFVFTAFSRQVTNLLHLIDEVAFSRLDLRLAHKLLDLSRGGDTVHATQQQLASEIGSAREVVSRVLSEFQRRGWVSSSRGNIVLVDRAALDRLTREP